MDQEVIFRLCARAWAWQGDSQYSTFAVHIACGQPNHSHCATDGTDYQESRNPNINAAIKILWSMVMAFYRQAFARGLILLLRTYDLLC